MLHEDTITKLIDTYKEEEKILNAISRAISSFEEYHDTIFKMELWMKVFFQNSLSGRIPRQRIAA